MSARHHIQFSPLLAVLLVMTSIAGCATGEQRGAPVQQAAQSGDDVETRGLPRARPQVQLPGAVAQPQAAPPPAPKPIAQQGGQLPTWPQRFEVRGPESASFGFAVTQPGPLVVDVQWQGSPLKVRLQGPNKLEQVGAGRVVLNYQVTPQDVQRGLLWGVGVSLQTPTPLPVPGMQATGTITVQHPPADQAAVQQAVQAATAQRRQPTQQEQAQAAAEVKARMDSAFRTLKAQFEQQRLQRHAALMAGVQPMIDRMRARGGSPIGGVGGGGRIGTRGIEGGETVPGKAPSEATEETGTRGVLQGTILVAPLNVVSNPVINSLSVAQGQPGDPVMITGSAFGEAAGEVHFVIGPGKDLVAPAGVIWRNDQIFATVPEATGVLGFNGTVYVKRATDKVSSNLVPFRFNPRLKQRQIKVPADYILQLFGGIRVHVYGAESLAPGVYRNNDYWFWGPQGNDQFFVNTRLQNGWTVLQPPSVFLSGFADGGAYLQDSRVGTNSPYVNVRWWVDAAGFLAVLSRFMGYSVWIAIQGPEGVPDGVVCKQAPCPPE